MGTPMARIRTALTHNRIRHTSPTPMRWSLRPDLTFETRESPRMENAMKHQKLLSLVAALAIGFAHSLAAEVKVIANLSVSADSISVAELKRVYLEQTRSLGDGSHVEPVLERSGSANATFLKDFLDINDDALQSY